MDGSSALPVRRNASSVETASFSTLSQTAFVRSAADISPALILRPMSSADAAPQRRTVACIAERPWNRKTLLNETYKGCTRLKLYRLGRQVGRVQRLTCLLLCKIDLQGVMRYNIFTKLCEKRISAAPSRIRSRAICAKSSALSLSRKSAMTERNSVTRYSQKHRQI